MTVKLDAAVVGIGESPYGKRGTLSHLGSQSLAVTAVRNACADAGLSVTDLDGFCSWNDDQNAPSALAPALGIPQWTYGTMVWGGGGSGLPTAVLNAAMAIATGVCRHVVVIRSIVQGHIRMGGSFVQEGAAVSARSPHGSYSMPFGLVVPPAFYAMRARRHMAVYGTTTEDLAEVAIVQRDYARNNPRAVYRTPITVEDHQTSRVVVDPLRLLDCCMESDGATAIIVSSVERAQDLRQPLVKIAGVSTLTERRWGSPISYTESDEALASAGHRSAADDLYAKTGTTPDDIDVALFYDGATIGVLLGLEDWRFAERGEAAAMVRARETRVGGRIPLNTHGGNLSEAYMQGASHLVEAVRQLRGTASNQVPDAETALYASGMGYAPMGGVLLACG